MICKKCGANIDIRRKHSDGSVQCPQCKVIYRPRTAQSQVVQPQRQTNRKQPYKKKKNTTAFLRNFAACKCFKFPVWVLIIIVILIAVLMTISIISLRDKDSSNNAGKMGIVENVEVVNDATPGPDFVGIISQAIQGFVGDGESIIDVSLTNRDLCVVVDLSNADPDPFLIEELAVSRLGSITDKILDYKDYDGLWDTITINFGSVGKVVNKKEDIEENEYGMRYFPMARWYELFNLV